MGLSTVDGVRANAASWNEPTMLPLVIQPRLPPARYNGIEGKLSHLIKVGDTPLALSSEYSCATLLNAWPSYKVDCYIDISKAAMGRPGFSAALLLPWSASHIGYGEH